MHRLGFMSLMVLCSLSKAVSETKAVPTPWAAPPLESQLGECPLNVSYLSSHPWIVQKCRSERAHCCEAIDDLARILLFSWLHRTNSFLLPDNRTAVVCRDAIQRHLQSQGIAEDVLEDCEFRPSNFVSGPQHCHRIQDLSNFETVVDTRGMDRLCNGSPRAGAGKFMCHNCIRAMVDVLDMLWNMAGGGKNSCALFVLMYVGGGINSYEELGPDAAYCILSAQNLSAFVAPLITPSVGLHGEHSKKNSSAVAIVVGISISAGVVLLLIGFYVVACSRRSEYCGTFVASKRLRSMRKQAQRLRESVDLSTGLIFFRFSDIKKATANFSAANVIGEGGFGTVYRGTLPNGSQVAVKRFNDSSTNGDEVFKHEVQVISSVKHRNLLPLKGYCIWSGNSEQHQHFLVSDFMANGSLADYLFKGNKPCLTWPQRYKIAVGIARGLAYLHNDAKPAIIHRDIKAANVLLDGDLNPLLADFGLARFKEEDRNKSHYTTKAVGTLGYVAPEYALYGHLTDKSDVFSFGILLLELMSGRRALDCGDPEKLIISDWAYELVEKGRAEEVIEKRIREERESLQRVVVVALQCAHPRVSCRPSIEEALTALEAIDRPLPEITVSLEGAGRVNNRAVSPTPDIEDGRISITMKLADHNLDMTSGR